jgi:hypothetical protein
MVVGFTTTYYVIQFVSDWWLSPGTPVTSTNKTDRHDITEMSAALWRSDLLRVGDTVVWPYQSH